MTSPMNMAVFFRSREGDFSSAPINRILDVIIAAAAIIFFGPLMLAVAAIIYFGDPGPVLFGHVRIGRGGRSFRCWKFRSMVVNSDERLAQLLAADYQARIEWETDHKLRNDPRVTALGRFLRKSSLDELPQLFNVFSGEMSIVGPRPIVAAEAPRYGRYFNEYCQVRPGITGLWQISGRSDTSYRRRVALDVTYVRSKSTALDLKILFLTVPCGLAAKGSC